VIAHAAEAGEDRGRVVVRLGSLALSNTAALEAAVHIARAFQSEIEGIFIEDPDLFEAAAHGFVREVGHFAGRPRPLSNELVTGDTAHFAVAVQRELSQIAARHRIPFKARSIRHGVVAALARACGERGPWNIIGFGEPIDTAEAADLVVDALSNVYGATGYIVAGRRAIWQPGPILVAAEDMDRFAGQLRVARGLAQIEKDQIAVVAIAADDIARDWLDAEVRLASTGNDDVTVMQPVSVEGVADLLPHILASCSPRLVVTRNGGLTAPHQALPRVLAALARPVFLTH